MNQINKFNINDFVHKELTSKSSGQKLSLSAVLSSACNFKDIFIVHEILLPGRKDSSPHSHTKKEEMIFILEGHPVLNYGKNRIDLAPGDFIGLEPSTNLHCLENLTGAAVKYLKICSNPETDVINTGTLD